VAGPLTPCRGHPWPRLCPRNPRATSDARHTGEVLRLGNLAVPLRGLAVLGHPCPRRLSGRPQTLTRLATSTRPPSAYAILAAAERHRAARAGIHARSGEFAGIHARSFAHAHHGPPRATSSSIRQSSRSERRGPARRLPGRLASCSVKTPAAGHAILAKNSVGIVPPALLATRAHPISPASTAAAAALPLREEPDAAAAAEPPGPDWFRRPKRPGGAQSKAAGGSNANRRP